MGSERSRMRQSRARALASRRGCGASGRRALPPARRPARAWPLPAFCAPRSAPAGTAKPRRWLRRPPHEGSLDHHGPGGHRGPLCPEEHADARPQQVAHSDCHAPLGRDERPVGEARAGCAAAGRGSNAIARASAKRAASPPGRSRLIAAVTATAAARKANNTASVPSRSLPRRRSRAAPASARETRVRQIQPTRPARPPSHPSTAAATAAATLSGARSRKARRASGSACRAVLAGSAVTATSLRPQDHRRPPCRRPSGQAGGQRCWRAGAWPG